MGSRGQRNENRIVEENRGLLHDGGDARSSLYLSMIALGCLDEQEERGIG